jgi:CubicO group peptidase (beta-lactamase class C family)
MDARAHGRGLEYSCGRGLPMTILPLRLIPLMLSAGLVLWAVSLAAQPAPPEAAPPAPRPGPVDPLEVEAFFDGLMAAHLAEKGIAGATVSVVRDGAVLFAKGYGFADVASRTPVDAERTLFRIASVTKLFTATAVMQMVEQGRLDLDADVTRYLDFEIPATFAEPITVRHLLTHTPGFEEDLRRLFTYDPAAIMPLRTWLIETMPARVRPPGQFSSYSNYGIALAAYVVERLSGEAWDAYLDRHIMEPLGMTRTTSRQPLPAHLAADVSTGYHRAPATWDPRPFEITMGGSPAGSISSTASDMARFMLAHLAGGVLDDARILEAETARLMHALAFTHDPRLPGFALGFFEMSSHGQRLIGHAGNTTWFHSVLALVPAHDTGVFVSYNTDAAASLTVGPVLNAFLDHYFPARAPPLPVRDGFTDRVAGLTGTYRFNRQSHTTFQKAMGLALSVTFRVDDGALVATTPIGVLRGVEEEPGLFREEHGHGRIAFRVDETGRATHAFFSLTPMMALERVPWHGVPALHFALLGGAFVVFAAVLLVGGTRSVLVWRRHAAGAPPALRLARRAMAAAAAANLGFVAALVVVATDLDALTYLSGPMTGLKVALAFPVVGAAFTVLALAGLVTAVRRGEGDRWARVRLSAAVAVGLLFAWTLNYWHLLGWRM